MGSWTKYEFGRESLPKRCFIFAGDIPEDIKHEVLSCYDEVLFHKHTVYERYIVRSQDQEHLLLFQVYGAPVISDVTYLLHDGGVEEIIFIGTAFGIPKGVAIGSIVVPSLVQCLEGLISIVFEEHYSKPNDTMIQAIKTALHLNKEAYVEGKTVSVPCTFFHPSSEKFDHDVVALEMELSTVCYVAHKLGMKCGAVLIISDNEEHTLLDDRTILYRRWMQVFKCLKKEIKQVV
ncbi:MAG TPA: hypothetical protein DCY20_06495 [Firmicutes bacterium]|nr:hypothetical protein [Bacillota bacterium]